MRLRVNRQPVSAKPVPFSRPLCVDEIASEGLDMTIEADPAERAAIARDVGLPSIERMAADFHIEPESDGRLAVTGEVKAKITQTCVGSLEQFESETEQPIDICFAPPRELPPSYRRQAGPLASRRHRDMPDPIPAPVIDTGEEDHPDPIVDGQIDLGTLAVEFFTLGLDLYPRKPGVQFAETVVGATEPSKASAFAALERLKGPS